jgi:hypothetical protein
MLSYHCYITHARRSLLNRTHSSIVIAEERTVSVRTQPSFTYMLLLLLLVLRLRDSDRDEYWNANRRRHDVITASPTETSKKILYRHHRPGNGCRLYRTVGLRPRTGTHHVYVLIPYNMSTCSSVILLNTHTHYTYTIYIYICTYIIMMCIL